MNRLLSANLEDAGTRAALDTLGEFESAAVASATTTKDVAAGKQVSAPGIGGALRRGGLRKEVEGRMAEGSREFLEAFSEVNDVRPVLFEYLACRQQAEETGADTRARAASNKQCRN